jgi:hypothetical protein
VEHYDRFKDLEVELTGFRRVEGQTEGHEGVGETLHAHTDMARDWAADHPGESGTYPSYLEKGGSPASHGLLLWRLS